MILAILVSGNLPLLGRMTHLEQSRHRKGVPEEDLRETLQVSGRRLVKRFVLVGGLVAKML